MTDPETRALTLAHHYAQIGQPQRVLTTLEQIESLETIDAWVLRSAALYDLERYREGAEAARRGLALEPEHVGLLDVLGINLIEAGDLEGAERALLAALDAWPDDPDLLCHYALACARAGQDRKAVKLVERAAELEPDSVDVLRVRAQVAHLAGDPKAQAYAEELLVREPEDRGGHILRANAFVERNDIRSAVRHFEEAARLDPSDREIAYVTRHNRALTHWSQLPIYPILRFGPLRVWVAWIAIVVVTTASGQTWLLAILVPVYLFMVVCSWTLAPLTRWWMQRRIR